MELIFARSTLARLGKASAGDAGTGTVLTAFGAGAGVWAGVVTVTEVVPAGAVDGTALGTFSVLVGAGGGAGATCFSFLSSTASGRGRTRAEPSLCPQRITWGTEFSPTRASCSLTSQMRPEGAVLPRCHAAQQLTPPPPWNVPIILDVSSSTSESSMSSTSRLSVTGSGEPVLRLPPTGDRELSSSPIPWKGDSEPVGDGASMLGEGTGDSSGSGSVAFNWSSFFFRLLTRLANVL